MRKVDYPKIRAKWRRWIKRISDSVSMLVLDDYIFRAMEAARKGNEIKPSNQVYRWAIRAYGTHGAVGIRRILDNDDKTYSLLLLLRKIERNPQVITRRSFKLRYSILNKELADGDFDDIAGRGAKYLPRSVVRADLQKIEAVSNKIKPVVNKVIAHRERKPKGLSRVTCQQLHDAICEIDRMCIRYCLILNQESVASMLPTVSASLADSDIRRVWRG